MNPRPFPRFTVQDLERLNPVRNVWFHEDSPSALAGRCLLDALEYLRVLPKFRARFREVANAHTIRLICQCLSDGDLDRPRVLERLKPKIEDACGGLRVVRTSGAPHYGDDFWDWAVILETFDEYRRHFPDSVLDDSTIAQEVAAFHRNVAKKANRGLMTPTHKGEWFGPATAAAAYRVLGHHRASLGNRIGNLLGVLESQSLELVRAGKYRGRTVIAHHALWHYGQVVARFPTQARQQAKALRDLACLEQLENSDKVYALARVLQGSQAVGDQKLVEAALEQLYRCQDLSRPLGEGLIGDNIKGSLNVLEALWPVISPTQKGDLGAMVDALLRLQVGANTIGIVVAVEREEKATVEAFRQAGAAIEKGKGSLSIEHANYRAVVCRGKSLLGAFDATRALLEDSRARWLFMAGIAGSLGVTETTGARKKVFRGPDKGDVVIGAVLAPFGIRDKVRTQVENAKVPMRGGTWKIVPADPTLFAIAHEAADELFGDSGPCHEGLIVTRPGIGDDPVLKRNILSEFPGGLAVEEEGYVVGLLGLVYGIPSLVVRGISDRAEGDKKRQGRDKKLEAREQVAAARIAAKLLVRTVELLSTRW